MSETELDLTLDAARLTARLVDVPSVSGDEKALADLVEQALRGLPHLTVDRYGNNVVARTRLGRPERVVLAGHLDTVPIAGNVPSRLDGDGVLWGCGTTDMKSGVAVQLRIAATVPEPNRDLTFVFYDQEEVASHLNGLGRIAEAHPDWLAGDFAVLLEPSDAEVEGGCQGTLRVLLHTSGERAHSARSWMGSNAIHAAAPILARLAAYEPRRPVIDGLEYHEGLNAVRIEGGVANNVIPDACTVTVNFRYAPTAARQKPSPTSRRSSRTAASPPSPSTTPPAAPSPGSRTRPRRPSWRPSAAAPCPSSAGPTSPASARSASPPSTTARATPCWPTRSTNGSTPRRSRTARNDSAPG
ncbi:Succinyl-diaminopimelate desuccinylase [Streptomyces sp. enrichment culture]